MKFLILTVLFIIPFYLLNAQVKPSGPVHFLNIPSSQAFQRPVPSPDGSYLLLTSSNNTGLWLYDLHRETINQINDDSGAGFGAVWSTSGALLLARTTTLTNGIRTHRAAFIRAADGHTEYLTPSRRQMATLPVFNHDESGILLQEQTSTVAYLSTQFSHLRKPTAASVPVLTSQSDRLYLTYPAGNEKRIRPFPDAILLNAMLSPDHSRIAFEVYGGNLFVLNLEDDSLTDLGVGYGPVWSPDGHYLVYMVTQDDGHHLTYSEIRVSRADGLWSDALHASDTELPVNPHWSHDGSRIYFDLYDVGRIAFLDVEVYE